MTGYFLWPAAARIGNIGHALLGASADSFEGVLSWRFPDVHPVAVSSGRAGISLVLALSGVGRRDKVGVFPYASYCVLETVVRYALPTEADDGNSPHLNIIYHQWGYVQPRSNRPWMEDAVDSLCMPAAQLCPLGGDFEIWSLPKILGVVAGGVVWCRDRETAVRLRTLRDQRGQANRQYVIAILASLFPKMYAYWAGMETLSGRMSNWAAASALHAFKGFDSIIEDRRRKFELLRPFAPQWLPRVDDRLPCIVPLEISDEIGAQLGAMGIKTNFRHFQHVDENGRSRLIRVFPLPIHQEVPLALLQRVAELLARARQLPS